MKRFRLDDSRISNASPETGTKDDNVNTGDTDFSIYSEEEKFEWKEITRGWTITPCIIHDWHSNNIIGLADWVGESWAPCQFIFLFFVSVRFRYQLVSLVFV